MVPYLNIDKVIKANEEGKKILYTGLDIRDDLFKTKLHAAGTLTSKNEKVIKLENCWLCPASSFSGKTSCPYYASSTVRFISASPFEVFSAGEIYIAAEHKSLGGQIRS